MSKSYKNVSHIFLARLVMLLSKNVIDVVRLHNIYHISMKSIQIISHIAKQHQLRRLY